MSKENKQHVMHIGVLVASFVFLMCLNDGIAGQVILGP
jgi:hypothetical protein